MTVILMCGPAGSGKTRYAKALESAGALRLSYDEEYWRRGYRGPHPVPAALASEVKNALDAQLREELAADGRDVVLDYSFSTRAMRDEYRERAADCGASIQLIYLTAPIETLLSRVAARNGANANDAQLTPDVVRRYVEGFDVPTPEEDAQAIWTG